MDHPYQNMMQLPASYAVITSEEMTYLDGGVDITLLRLGDHQFVLDTDAFSAFCARVVVNLGYFVMTASYSSVSSMLESGLNNGLSLAGSIQHRWGKLATPASKVAAIGTVGLAGLYVYTQAYGIIQSLKNLYDTIVQPMPSFDTADSTTAA